MTQWVQDNALALLGIGGSVIAFGFAVWQGLYTRLSARISALPLLHPFQRSPLERIEPPHQQAYFRCKLLAQIINGGLGPAVITKYEVHVDGKPFDPSNKQEVERVAKEAFGIDPANSKIEYFHLSGAIALPKDGVLDALSLTFFKSTPAECEQVIKQLERIALRIEYQSMHGDELLFESTKPALPPKLSLFCLHKRPPQP